MICPLNNNNKSKQSQLQKNIDLGRKDLGVRKGAEGEEG